jgi:cytochrome c
MHSQLGSRSFAWLAGVVSAACALALLAALAGASPAAAQGTAPECRYSGADAFNGTSLDVQNRWKSTLRHDASLYTVADGKVKVQTGPYEIQQNEQGNGAPNIFLQPAPSGTWEVTTKVKIDHTTEGQQAGLLVTDPTGQNLVKLAFVQKGATDNNNR